MTLENSSFPEADWVNRRLRKLWNDFNDDPVWKKNVGTKNKPETIEHLLPMQYPPLKKRCILFIGLNPSFQEIDKRIKKFSEKYKSAEDYDLEYGREVNKDRFDEFRECWEKDSFYPNDKNNIDTLGFITDFEEYAKDEYGSYYNNLKGFILNLFLEESDSKRQKIDDYKWRQLPIEHIDLFAIREGSGTKVKKALNIRAKSEEDYNRVQIDLGDISEFGKEQIEIAIDLIVELDPRVVIVINATASHIINSIQKCTESSYPENWELDNLHKSISDIEDRLVFSGMLSGGHSLDVYSRKRLNEVVKNRLKENGDYDKLKDQFIKER